MANLLSNDQIAKEADAYLQYLTKFHHDFFSLVGKRMMVLKGIDTRFAFVARVLQEASP